MRIVVFSDYNMVAFLFVSRQNRVKTPKCVLKIIPRKDRMEPTPNHQTNPNFSHSVEADKSIAQAYQAAADFMKELEED